MKRKHKISVAIAVPAFLKGLELYNYARKKEYDNVKMALFGINSSGTFVPETFIKEWAPMALGTGLHFVARESGVNKELANAGIPWVNV